MWFKKASVIASENGKPNAAALKSKSPDGQDRTSKGVFETPPNNTSITQKVPDDRSKYFFLPAIGHYVAGKLTDFGGHGRYWTSTPYKNEDNVANSLLFRGWSIEFNASSIPNKTIGQQIWTMK